MKALVFAGILVSTAAVAQTSTAANTPATPAAPPTPAAANTQSYSPDVPTLAALVSDGYEIKAIDVSSGIVIVQKINSAFMCFVAPDKTNAIPGNILFGSAECALISDAKTGSAQSAAPASANPPTQQ